MAPGTAASWTGPATLTCTETGPGRRFVGCRLDLSLTVLAIWTCTETEPERLLVGCRVDLSSMGPVMLHAYMD